MVVVVACHRWDQGPAVKQECFVRKCYLINDMKDKRKGQQAKTAGGGKHGILVNQRL